MDRKVPSTLKRRLVSDMVTLKPNHLSVIIQMVYQICPEAIHVGTGGIFFVSDAIENGRSY